MGWSNPRRSRSQLPELTRVAGGVSVLLAPAQGPSAPAAQAGSLRHRRARLLRGSRPPGGSRTRIRPHAVPAPAAPCGQRPRDEPPVPSSPHPALLQVPQVCLTCIRVGDGLSTPSSRQHAASGWFHLGTVSHPFFVGQSIQRGWKPAAGLQGRMSAHSLCLGPGRVQPRPWSSVGGVETNGHFSVNAHGHPHAVPLGAGGRLPSLVPFGAVCCR